MCFPLLKVRRILLPPKTIMTQCVIFRIFIFLVTTLTINLSCLQQVHACVYPLPKNGEILTVYVSEKLVEAKLDPSVKFNIPIEGSAVTVSLSLNGQIAHVAWELSEACDYRPVSVSSEHSLMAGLNLEAFARVSHLSQQCLLRRKQRCVHK